MTHEEYMQQAIETAKESEQESGTAIGAVLVRDGEIIATGKSLVWQHKDPTEHAETNCIRSACKKLETTDLEGCVLYGTLEPCSMCLGASGWANISEIYFGAYREDVIGNDYIIEDWYSEKAEVRNTSHNKVKVVGGILRKECAGLLKDYKNWMK